MSTTNRNLAFDTIKGIAILAVVFYHYGLCRNGYLGVDIFLVIAGFFTAKSLWKNIDHSITGGGGKYLYNRALRLLPLLLLAEIIILLYGFLLMMPDDFENVSQSIIASNFFSNNVLADITTKNYWDVVNEYKPLMHTWYLGVLVQFYVLFVLTDILIARIKGKKPEAYIVCWTVLSIVSLIFYLSDFSASTKFYHIPFRIFEFGMGSLMFYFSLKYNKKIGKTMSRSTIIIAYISLLTLLFVNINLIEKRYMLLLAVLLTSVLTYLLPRSEFSNNKFWFNKPLAIIGAASFSLYIWHQIVLALARYSFISELKTLVVFLAIMSIVGILTYVSYRYIERIKITRRFVVVVTTCFIITNICAFVVYARAGIFYDIPELGITTKNFQRGMWAEYCDRGFLYDKPYDNSGKPKWMVVGNSFGRDFVNIIRESSVKDSIDLSYAAETKSKEHIDRIGNADIVFISTLGLSEELVNKIRSLMSKNSRLIIVGEKNFGVNNGQVFRKRKRPDYHQSTVEMETGYNERNEKFRKIYATDFLDLIKIVKLTDGRVRVFSDDGRFISQDCRHLTHAGAKFFSNKINWAEYLRP